MLKFTGQAKSIFFIGIGGVGVGGIAELCLQAGFKVTGSDAKDNIMTKRLRALGIKIEIGHSASLPEAVDVVVYSSAIDRHNPQLAYAIAQGKRCVRRGDFLGELMQGSYGIAVCGTHGKTTTTGLITSMLVGCGKDPAFAIGGLQQQLGCYARMGKDELFVVEADESDVSFLALPAKVAVITNIDYDHMEAYSGDFSCLKQAFAEFVLKLPQDGVAVVCWDDPIIREIMRDYKGTMLTYGEHKDADFCVANYRQVGLQMQFEIHSGSEVIKCKLHKPGLHNALNAAAAFAIGHHLGFAHEKIAASLAGFVGMGRRFEVHGDFKVGGHDVTVIEDYAHHPRELEVTLLAAQQAWPQRRIVIVCQPHRFSRVGALLPDFAASLSLADRVVLTPIYTAGEEPIPGVTAQAIADQVAADVDCSVLSNLDQLSFAMQSCLQDGDVVLFVGAGSISYAWQQMAADKVALH